jgi:hypothetical protein
VILAVDWATVAKLATAGATLSLATATFASVRSANRAARTVERSLRAGMRAVLLPTRPDDPPQTIAFPDDRRLTVPGGGAVTEVTAEAIYLAMPIRNLGGGLAVLRGWSLHAERAQDEHATVEEFNPLTCDLHLAGSETVVWQSMLQDLASTAFTSVREAVLARQPLSLGILYCDQEETQRTIARFALTPATQDGMWLAAVNRHGNPDPLRPAVRTESAPPGGDNVAED